MVFPEEQKLKNKGVNLMLLQISENKRACTMWLLSIELRTTNFSVSKTIISTMIWIFMHYSVSVYKSSSETIEEIFWFTQLYLL